VRGNLYVSASRTPNSRAFQPGNTCQDSSPDTAGDNPPYRRKVPGNHGVASQPESVRSISGRRCENPSVDLREPRTRITTPRRPPHCLIDTAGASAASLKLSTWELELSAIGSVSEKNRARNGQLHVGNHERALSPPVASSIGFSPLLDSRVKDVPDTGQLSLLGISARIYT
jgi:hypothetical protein